jgi:5-methylcytosine-specific restriction endonuclease McrA
LISSAPSASPWTIGFAVLVAVGMLVRVFRFFRWLTLTSSTRDPQRRFAGADRAAIMRRAGGRCEFHGLMGGRCRATDKLQADHIHPHSRGGTTTVGNGQSLCARHNKAKAAHIPFEWQVRRMVKRRAGYFPIGESTAVVRRDSPAVIH